jgi:myo-inositol 2-dehydrogenase/D-chiro-inositol 1-dehydrogenase/scyllo-inositol 2-dehydrogenase (NAD+)
MQKVKLGLIGLGYIGQIHLRNSLRLANARIEAVADVSKLALHRAKKDGVKKTFISYEELLEDPQIEGVIIALPTHLHLECAKKAAEAKKHIFLEKPIARNVAEAKEIISAAQKNHVKLMIGYPLRFNSVMCNLKNKIRNGELGDVIVAYATNVSTGPFMHRAHGYTPVPVPEWWFKKELTGGGVLIDLGPHMINLLRWYFGEFADIKSYLSYRFNLDFEDQAICLGRFESGTTAVINLGYFSQKYQLKVELLGTVGHAVSANIPPNPIYAGLQMLVTGTSNFWRPYIAELAHFANCIANDTPPSPSGRDGLKDLEAIARAYKNQIRLE